jgi:hypothetical protein
MNLGRKSGAPVGRQGRRYAEFARAALVRQLYPSLTELRVEIEFEDGSDWAPSAQSFSYFPAARGYFRYACPCHACNGEFDLTGKIESLTVATGGAPRSLRVEMPCEGHRAGENDFVACAVRARVRIKAVVARKPGSSDDES